MCKSEIWIETAAFTEQTDKMSEETLKASDRITSICAPAWKCVSGSESSPQL